MSVSVGRASPLASIVRRLVGGRPVAVVDDFLEPVMTAQHRMSTVAAAKIRPDVKTRIPSMAGGYETSVAARDPLLQVVSTAGGNHAVIADVDAVRGLFEQHRGAFEKAVGAERAQGYVDALASGFQRQNERVVGVADMTFHGSAHRAEVAGSLFDVKPMSQVDEMDLVKRRMQGRADRRMMAATGTALGGVLALGAGGVAAAKHAVDGVMASDATDATPAKSKQESKKPKRKKKS